MKIADICMEGRDAPLYHGTGMGSAMAVIRDNRFNAKTQHVPKPGGLQEDISGVSFSRSLVAASSFGDVVFAVDQAILAHHHRIMPLDFWGHSDEPMLAGGARRHGKYAEAEEFVIGDILHADRYITAILIAPRTLSRLKRNFPDSGTSLFQHPLLRVVDIGRR